MMNNSFSTILANYENSSKILAKNIANNTVTIVTHKLVIAASWIHHQKIPAYFVRDKSHYTIILLSHEELLKKLSSEFNINFKPYLFGLSGFAYFQLTSDLLVWSKPTSPTGAVKWYPYKVSEYSDTTNAIFEV